MNIPVNGGTNDDIEAFLENRLRSVYERNISLKYSQARSKTRVLYDQLYAQLNEEQNKVLCELVDAHLDMELTGNEEFYKQGARDGIKTLLQIF